MYRTLNAIVITVFMTMAVFAFDDKQTLKISADSSMFNFNTGENIYEGNVQVIQDTTHLNADKIITKNNKEHKIIEAKAFGGTKLAEYSTIPKPGDPIFKATAKIITFYPPTFTVVLEGNVKVTQGENSFQGPLILYNMKDQIVTAPASKIGQATFMIEPDKIHS